MARRCLGKKLKKERKGKRNGGNGELLSRRHCVRRSRRRSQQCLLRKNPRSQRKIRQKKKRKKKKRATPSPSPKKHKKDKKDKKDGSGDSHEEPDKKKHRCELIPQEDGTYILKFVK